jgi:hypothetical protein
MLTPDKSRSMARVYHRPAAASAPIATPPAAALCAGFIVGASLWGTIAMTRGWRWLRLVAPILGLMIATPALADCTDEVCGSLQKILAARSGNFAKLKGKATVDPRGDPVWQGTQAIGGLINTCYVYKRGEGARYEYRCDSSGFGAEPSQPPEKAKQIAEAVKAAFQAADPTLAWFEDPATRALAGIEGFQGTQGWYGGYVKNKSMVARVEIVLSNVTGNATIVTVKPLTRRDLK